MLLDERAYLAALIASMLISGGFAAYSWRRSAPPVRSFAALTSCEAAWTFGYICELYSGSLEAKILWDDFQWIFSVGVPTALLHFALTFSDRRLRRPGRVWSALLGANLAGLTLVMTDSYTGLIRGNSRLESSGAFTVLMYDYRPLCLVLSLGLVAVSVAATGILLAYILRAPALYRRQSLTVFAGVVFPIISSFIAMSGLDLGFQRDTFPFTFAMSNLVIAAGLFRFRLFDVVPLARTVVLESLEDIIITLDTGNRILDLNAAAARAFDRKRDEVIGLDLFDALGAWPDLKDLAAGPVDFEMDVSRVAGGERTWFNLRSTRIRQPGGVPVGRVLILRDITRQKLAEIELRRHQEKLEELVRDRTAELSRASEHLHSQMAERALLEEQFRQSQKMEAMGRLAGGVAHDLNNLLVPITGYAELSLSDAPEGGKLHRRLTQIREAAARAGDLTRQILAFSRQQVLDMRVIDARGVVSGIESMIRRLVGEDLELITSVAADPCRCVADRSQIEQIIMNLAVNARDAMPRGGRLEISVRRAELGVSESAAVPDLPGPGSYVVLSVRDNGEGMDSATQAKIYEPFFTTKALGKGTGLGLSTVFGIVRQHEGGIRLTSRRGEGSLFEIFLPATDAPEEPDGDNDITPRPGSEGETILIAEDEDMVRRLVAEELETAGYTVLQAPGAREALEIAGDPRRVIHLLLTDMIMPGMNGRQLYAHVREVRPDVRVLYMSGYTDSAMKDRGVLQPGENFISKPFTMIDLARKVRSAISSPPPPPAEHAAAAGGAGSQTGAVRA